jgi:hypothetical protein
MLIRKSLVIIGFGWGFGWLIAVGLISCGSTNHQSVPLYEDDPNAEINAKADGTGLFEKYLVSEYQPMLEPRLVVDSFSAQLFGESRTYAIGDRVVLIRSLMLDGEPSYVLVNAADFELKIVSKQVVDTVTTLPTRWQEKEGYPYLQALERSKNGVLCHLDQPHIRYDHGINVTTTVDMCQSRRTWEAGFYQWLVELGLERNQPQSVGVAMTGLWAHRHSDKFNQLVEWDRNNLLDVRWINHSYHHQLSKTADGRYLFLTDPAIDFEDEVLSLEKLLLEQGVMFSLLFRFPGLTHDAGRLRQLSDLGLFALDANAWVAKGELVENGSVILLHGNGNEPVGIEMFFEWVEALKKNSAFDTIHFVDPLDVLPRQHAQFTQSTMNNFVSCDCLPVCEGLDVPTADGCGGMCPCCDGLAHQASLGGKVVDLISDAPVSADLSLLDYQPGFELYEPILIDQTVADDQGLFAFGCFDLTELEYRINILVETEGYYPTLTEWVDPAGFDLARCESNFLVGAVPNLLIDRIKILAGFQNTDENGLVWLVVLDAHGSPVEGAVVQSAWGYDLTGTVVYPDEDFQDFSRGSSSKNGVVILSAPVGGVELIISKSGMSWPLVNRSEYGLGPVLFVPVFAEYSNGI